MNLELLGWLQYLAQTPAAQDLSQDIVARVAVENKHNYLLYSFYGELLGIIRGKLLKTATQESDLPKVGDWVVIEKLPNEQKAVIISVLPRASTIARQRVEENHQRQVIATNVDVLFIVQSLDNDFSVDRLQRYVLMAREGGSSPIILLNKIDTAKNIESKIKQVQTIIPHIKVFPVSAATGEGLHAVQQYISPGMTVAFVGSSGVGKSTLINTLVGTAVQSTGEVRAVDGKGRHTTTKREIVLLPSGGILIDTPGMRELDVEVSIVTLHHEYDDINALAVNCKFNDCDHVQDHECAVLAALIVGDLDKDRYEQFIRARSNIAVKHRKEKKSRQEARRRADQRTIKGYKIRKKK